MINDLPVEIIFEILKYCFFESILSLNFSCKYLRDCLILSKGNKNVKYLIGNIKRDYNMHLYFNLFGIEFYVIQNRNKLIYSIPERNRKCGKKGFFQLKSSRYRKITTSRNKTHIENKNFLFDLKNKRIFEIISKYKKIFNQFIKIHLELINCNEVFL